LRDALGALPDVDVVDTPVGAQPQPRAQIHVAPPGAVAWSKKAEDFAYFLWDLEDVRITGSGKRATLLVPSTHLQKHLAGLGIASHVVHYGVPPSFAGSAATARPLLQGEALRFLWVSSGIEADMAMLDQAWRVAFGGPRLPGTNRPELRLKFVGPSNDVESRERHGTVVHIDQRRLSPQAMRDLYEHTDVFISSHFHMSYGPTCDAMACGALAIVPPTRSHPDFAGPLSSIVVSRPGPAPLALALQAAAVGWGRPDLEALRRAGVARARAMTWASTARKIVSVVQERLAGLADHGLRIVEREAS
jgi:hypothetical protein